MSEEWKGTSAANEAEKTENSNGKKKKAKVKRRRSTALWFAEKGIVLMLWILGLFAGMYAGYTYLGKGEPSDVFHVETWKHVYDLIFSDS